VKKIGLVVVIIIIVVIIWRIYPTEERKLKRDIKALAKAFEAENTDEVAEYLDGAYTDLNGMNYDEISYAIEQFFTQVESITVQLSGLKPSIDSTSEMDEIFASCSLGLRVLARFEGERVLAFGGIVHPASVRAFFRKSDGIYRVYYAQY